MLGSLPRLRPLILAEEVAFPQLITKFPQPITKLMVRLEQHKFYSATKEWRSESLVHKSTSQPNLGQGKSKEIESREGGIFMTYLRTGCGLDLEQVQLSFPVLAWAFPVSVMAIVTALAPVGVSLSIC